MGCGVEKAGSDPEERGSVLELSNGVALLDKSEGDM